MPKFSQISQIFGTLTKIPKKKRYLVLRPTIAFWTNPAIRVAFHVFRSACCARRASLPRTTAPPPLFDFLTPAHRLFHPRFSIRASVPIYT